jgi:hypothetical protein
MLVWFFDVLMIEYLDNCPTGKWSSSQRVNYVADLIEAVEAKQSGAISCVDCAVWFGLLLIVAEVVLDGFNSV